MPKAGRAHPPRATIRQPYARTLPELLHEQAVHRPDALAVISGESSTTYAELDDRARRVAAALRARGVQRGDRVGLIVNNRTEWLEICFGSSALGAVVVPFSTWSTRNELDFLLTDSGVRTLFTLERFGARDFAADIAALVPESVTGERSWRSSRYPSLSEIILVAGERGSWMQYEEFAAGAPIEAMPVPGGGASAADDALILYTSGSASFPKGVRLTHFGTIENGFNIGERQGLRPEDRVLLSPPLFWAYGAVNALPATFTHGATLVLQERFEAGQALDLIESHRCTAIYTLPSITSALLEHSQFLPRRTRSLRTGLTIGSPQEVLRAAKELGASGLCNIYGSTETYGNCCVTPHDWPLERRARSQGEPLPGVEIRIVDPESAQPLGKGEAGAVEVRGYVTPGYYGQSSANNAAAFTDDGFFRTGDIGQLTEAGEFIFVGRSAEVIKKSGINVSPAEVEDALLQHPHVLQAGVVGLGDTKQGEIIIAFVVPIRDAEPAVDDLREHCRRLLSGYKVPDRIEICPSLPTTTTGKVMRRELKNTAATLMAAGTAE